jgi:hypothetical protein
VKNGLGGVKEASSKDKVEAVDILKGFVFSNEAMEIIEELNNIEAKLNKAGHGKPRSLYRASLASLSTNDLLDRKENRPLAESYNLDDDSENIEKLRARRESLKNELQKLEMMERKKYNSANVLEKQNFEVSFCRYSGS